jgi:hypothetical protein
MTHRNETRDERLLLLFQRWFCFAKSYPNYPSGMLHSHQAMQKESAWETTDPNVFCKSSNPAITLFCCANIHRRAGIKTLFLGLSKK